MELLSSKEEVKLLRCGVRFSPPAVIVTYAASGKTRRRIMPLRNFSKNSVVQHVAAELNSRHKRYLERMPAAQLEKLISMLRDQLSGMSRDEVIAKAQSLEHIDPDEDLNKVDDISLNFKKAVMDQTFEKNRKRPNDPDFKYDVEVDFTSGPIETCGWDSDDDNDDNAF